MSKTKGLSKKKKLLKTLMDEYLPFITVLLIVFLYAVIAFINIPINKWLSFNCPQWSDGEYHFYDAFFVLPLFELIICFIVFAVCYFASKITAYRNYCCIPPYRK